jgi:DNA polymerase-1
MGFDGRDLVGLLRQAGVTRSDLVGLVVTPDGTAAIAVIPRAADDSPVLGPASVPAPIGASGARQPSQDDGAEAAGPGWVTSADEVARADEQLRPRWVAWSGETAARLAGCGVRLATCWDVAAVHRVLFGGWRADPGWAWAHLHGLPLDAVPTIKPGELFGATGQLDAGDPETTGNDDPIGPGGYLRPAWIDGEWASTPARMIAWARLAHQAALTQRTALAIRGTREDRIREDTVRSESTAELLCAELATDGLPVHLASAERILTEIIGPRPRDRAEAARLRAARDERVLRHAPAAAGAMDLRSPVQVKALLKQAAGIDVPDTRAWRLEQYRGTHPLVEALLEWRKAERIATTYGYAWLDAYLGADGRLRGSWTGSDGAAGRMTASAGLHNMPAILRQAVIADDGHVFIRADLGQVEPRVLAAVSGDRALIAATEADDLYLPVAAQLGIDRPTAKVAMIAAMYGQTTGHGGQAARRMKVAYPIAMAYLDDADRRAMAGQDLRTYGGRLVKMSGGGALGAMAGTAAGTEHGGTPGGNAGAQQPESPARVAARGRYGRNAMIQGAAAELFKMWAVTMRARTAHRDARIVLCLHDELLVHVREEEANEMAELVSDCLQETARRWAPGTGATGRVRFLADIATVRCWADAKPALTSPAPVDGGGQPTGRDADGHGGHRS